MPTYLEQLTIRLATGIGMLGEEVRQRHGDYLRSLQCEDGGFPGRDHTSDLYYTGFALRSLAIMGQLEGETAQRTADFLRGRLHGRESIIDALSLVYGGVLLEFSTGIDVFDTAPANWRDTLAATLGKLRRDDGGYAKTPEGNASSTYHTFLVVLCLELIDKPIDRPEAIASFLLSQQSEGGGFREIRVGKRASTNPTAAAVATLRIVDRLGDANCSETIDFLLDMQTDEGGLRANTRIPIADLLSTFTGLTTLADLGAERELELRDVSQYAHSLERAEGGFHGAIWDEAADPEYTFYGLGTLALLAQAGV